MSHVHAAQPAQAAGPPRAAQPGAPAAPAAARGAASPANVAARAAAFAAALEAAVPGENLFTQDAALQAQYAAGVIAALDAAFADGLVSPNELVDLGPYSGIDRGGKAPFYMQPQHLQHLAMHSCAGLRHALMSHGADPNIRYEIYDYPHIYSITPLHTVVKHAARVADIWGDMMPVDATAMARALLEAGAEPDAACEIAACYDAEKPAAAAPYDGPRYGASAAMMLAAPRKDVACGGTTGPVCLAMLRELFKHGAKADAQDGEGMTLREQPLLTPEARALLDELAAA